MIDNTTKWTTFTDKRRQQDFSLKRSLAKRTVIFYYK